MSRRYEQKILSGLLKKKIQDMRTTAVEDLITSEDKLKSEKKRRDNSKNRAGFIANIVADIIAPGSGKIVKPLVEYINSKSQGDFTDEIKDAYALDEDYIGWGIGDMYKNREKEVLKAEKENRPNIWDTLEEAGQGFLGKGFLDEWKKGGTSFMNEPIEGLSILDRLFAQSYENGGMVKKYQEGGMVNTGDSFSVKAGDYKKWVTKKDPYTGVPFREKQTFAKYKTYTMQDDGTWKIGSTQKSNLKTDDRRLKSKSEVLALTNKSLVEGAGQYLAEGDTGLYKKDEDMQTLIEKAKSMNKEESEPALYQIAMLWKAQRPESKNKPIPELIAEIKSGLSTVSVDLGGETFTNIENIRDDANILTEATLDSGQETIATSLASTYDPSLSARDQRKQRADIGSDLASIYTTYGASRDKTSRAFDEATDAATDLEFSGLDTLFSEIDA